MADPFRSLNGSASATVALQEVRDLAAHADLMFGQTLEVLREHQTRILALEAEVAALKSKDAPALACLAPLFEVTES